MERKFSIISVKEKNKREFKTPLYFLIKILVLILGFIFNSLALAIAVTIIILFLFLLTTVVKLFSTSIIIKSYFFTFISSNILNSVERTFLITKDSSRFLSIILSLACVLILRE